MNRACLVGRICKDIEMRQSQSGVSFASFALAVNRSYKKDGQPTADFINCKVFGKTAEFMGKYMSMKGLQIAVEGRIQTGSYEKDGNKVFTTDVMVDSAYFADSKKESNGDSYEQPIEENKNATDSALKVDDDLPF